MSDPRDAYRTREKSASDTTTKVIAWRVRRELYEWKFTDNRAEMQSYLDNGYEVQPLCRAPEAKP